MHIHRGDGGVSTVMLANVSVQGSSCCLQQPWAKIGMEVKLCTYAYMHICIYAYMCTCVHICKHTCTHVLTYAHGRGAGAKGGRGRTNKSKKPSLGGGGHPACFKCFRRLPGTKIFGTYPSHKRGSGGGVGGEGGAGGKRQQTCTVPGGGWKTLKDVLEDVHAA